MSIVLKFNKVYIESKESGSAQSRFEQEENTEAETNEQLQRDEKDEYINNIITFKRGIETDATRINILGDIVQKILS